MSALDVLRRAVADRGEGRAVALGLAATLGWLALVLILSWLAPGDGAGGSWLARITGTFLPIALIWFAVWSAQALAGLRREAEELKATLAQIRGGGSPGAEPYPAEAPPPRPAPRKIEKPAPKRQPAPLASPAHAEADQAGLDLGMTSAPELTPAELALALNFPDGPDDREAIRCLHLALADPGLARLIRAAQDVVTLMAGQGVYMDDLIVPATDPRLWRRFAEGERGNAVAGLAVIDDAPALAAADGLLQSDEVFRDVAHHFLRHFDRLLGQRVGQDGEAALAVMADTRSGRAFLLLAQASGMIGAPPASAPV